MPEWSAATLPVLPRWAVTKVAGTSPSFDAGRGCPFQCSFCTIINVQGRKSRYRTADDVERIVRANAAQNITRFFVTDDNFARNRNWEPILDRMIELRERDGFQIRLLLQVDTLDPIRLHQQYVVALQQQQQQRDELLWNSSASFPELIEQVHAARGDRVPSTPAMRPTRPSAQLARSALWSRMRSRIHGMPRVVSAYARRFLKRGRAVGGLARVEVLVDQRAAHLQVQVVLLLVLCPHRVELVERVEHQVDGRHAALDDATLAVLAGRRAARHLDHAGVGLGVAATVAILDVGVGLEQRLDEAVEHLHAVATVGRGDALERGGRAAEHAEQVLVEQRPDEQRLVADDVAAVRIELRASGRWSACSPR